MLLTCRTSHLGESNPRPTHYEGDAPNTWTLYQHRQHPAQHRGNSTTWANAIRHARTHASDRSIQDRVAGRVSDASGVRRSRWLDHGQALAVATAAAEAGLLGRYWRGSPLECVGAALPRAHPGRRRPTPWLNKGQPAVLGRLTAMAPRQAVPPRRRGGRGARASPGPCGADPAAATGTSPPAGWR